MNAVIYIGSIAVETDSVLIAAKVANAVGNLNQVRGTHRVGDDILRWSTIQQFEHHGSFVPSETPPCYASRPDHERREVSLW